MTSLHGVDYYPHEPRLGVHYELLDMTEVDRVTVTLRVPTDAPTVDSVTPDGKDGAGWPTADLRSARSMTCSASSSPAILTCVAS